MCVAAEMQSPRGGGYPLMHISEQARFKRVLPIALIVS
jgi:hypothetical protein